MADVTEAPNQEAVAESLLGDETEQQTVEQQPETEQQLEVQEESQPEAAEQQEQEEVAEDWLPTDQDKVFPDEVLNRYATRYGLTEDALADPQLRQLLTDKINSDIYIAQQQQVAEEQPEEREEQSTEPQTQVTPEQYFGQLDRLAQQRTSPEAAKWFHSNFLKAFGVPDAEIAKIPQEQAIRFGQVATAGIANVANTIIDDLLQSRIEPLLSQIFPGFGEMYQKAAYASAWDGVRNSDAKYATLPAFGTKEFAQTLRSASAKIPGFDDLLPENVKPAEAAKYYKMLAHFAVTGNVDPSLLQRAAAAGAKSARRAEVRRSAGNLGSGQSKGAQASGASKFQSNQDLFDDETLELYHQQHGRL